MDIIGRKETLDHFEEHADQKRKENKIEAEKFALEGLRKCCFCLQEFSNEHELETHEDSFHIKRQYMCPVCNKNFSNPQQYVHHMNSHGPTAKLYRCTDCNFQTTYYFSYLAHVKSHERDASPVCEYCNASFKTGKELSLHLRWRHSYGNATYQCKLCLKEFTSKSYVRKHIKCKHFGQKRPQPRKIICHKCGKNLPEHRLASHMRVHNDVKPFECTYCDKSFTEKRYFTDHIRTHTGERPFVCHICNKGFTQRTPLTVHLRKHTDETPYKCQLCSKAFVSKQLLDNHMKQDLHD